MNNQLLLMLAVWLSAASPAMAATGTHSIYEQAIRQTPVKGIVVGADGTPLPGVSIKSVTSNKGTTTNDRGEFSIDAAPGDQLVFTFIGYTQQ
ncbi:MAG: TonB-dependent receptor, partial [Bacteroidetes bacterium]|nr:TonB-dependent receptor [Bacteroidota bacterium]